MNSKTFLLRFQPSPVPSRRESSADLTKQSSSGPAPDVVATSESLYSKPLFTKGTKAIIWGMQQRAVQGMMDFDYVCSRKQPSVVAMIYPFT